MLQRVRNEHLEVALAQETGHLVSITNRVTGRQHRSPGTPAPVFELEAVSFDCNSRFYRPEDVRRLVPDETTCQHVWERNDGERRWVEVTHHFFPDIWVRYEVSLEPDSDVADWTISVENRAPERPSEALIVHRVAFPLLSGVRAAEEAADERLALPKFQGQMLSDPRATLPENPYVLYYIGNASMTWMDLHHADATDGLYLASHDEDLPQTELRVWKDQDNLGLGITRWTFLNPGNTWEGGPCAVGVHCGDWHRGSEIYRQWFLSWAKPAAVPEWLQQSDGWYGLGGPHYTFAEMPDLLDSAKSVGLDYLQLWSQMLGGDETYYPYLFPNPTMGTPEDLKAGIAKVHEAGGHVGFYLNMIAFDGGMGDFLASPKYRDAVPPEYAKPEGWHDGWLDVVQIGPEGRYRRLPTDAYADGYRVACPSARQWQEYLTYWIADHWVKEWGADCWYMDGFPHYNWYGAEPNVCFNTDHGPGRPHGFTDGAVESLRKVAEAALSAHPDFAFVCEGQVDFAYLSCTHTLGIEFNPDLTTRPTPEIFTYTFPELLIFSGTCNNTQGVREYYDDLETVERKDPWNRVFLMGYRFDILAPPGWSDEDPDRPYLRRLLALRRCIKAELYASKFRDTLGLGDLPKGVEAKVFVHTGRSSITLTLLDRRTEKTPLEVELDLELHEVSELSAGSLHTFDGGTHELNVHEKQGGVRMDLPTFEAEVAAIVLR